MCVLFNRNKVVSALSLFPKYLKIEFGGTKHVTHAQTNHQYNHRQRQMELVARQILFLDYHPHDIHTNYIFLLLINE
jgi:hypothetical protein